MMKSLLKALVFLGIGVGILYYVYVRQQAAYSEQCKLDGIPASQCSLLDKVMTDFSGADFRWLALVALLFVISNFSRAARWRMLLRPLGYRPRFVNLLFSIFIGYFANLGLPRMGELIRATSLSRYERIPVDKVVGTIVVDRVVDMLSFLLVFALALVFESKTLLGYLSENGRLPGKSLITSPLFWGVLAGVGIALFLIFKNWDRLGQNVIIKKIQNILKGIADGIKTISRLDNVPGFLFHSVVIWLMYYLMTYLCFNAFEPTAHLGPGAGLLVFVFASLGMIVPSPGGMGTYHAMVVAGLSLFGIASGDSFSFANIIFFTIQIFGIIVFGLLALLAMPLVNRHYAPAPAKIPNADVEELVEK